MTNEEYIIMLDASDSVYKNGIESVPEGYELDNTFEDKNKNGFQGIVFKSKTTDEYIVSFAGTQDLQDVHADINLGWTQWQGDVRDEVVGYINNLVVNVGATKIHFTGHSLGGALAQYALYEYIDDVSNTGDGSLNVEVSITTFNSLGGLDGLVQNFGTNNEDKTYNPILLNDYDIDGTHFYVEGDYVSQLGGGHIGGTVNYLKPSGDRSFNFLEAHSLPTVQTIINLDEFKYSGVNPQRNYLDLSQLQQFSAEISTFFSSDSSVDNQEAGLRLGATFIGVLATYMGMTPQDQADAEGQLDLFFHSMAKNVRQASDSIYVQSAFAVLENISYESLLGHASKAKYGDVIVGGSLVLSLVAVAISDVFGSNSSVSDLPPVWKDRMPDDIVEQMIFDYAATLPVIGPAITAVNLLEQLISMGDETLPLLNAETFEIQAGQSDIMTLTMSEAQNRELAVLVKVHDSERLLLTGDGVTMIDEALGKYRVSFSAGMTRIDINVSHLMYGNVINAASEIDFYLVPLNEINGNLDNSNQSTVTLTLTDFEISEHTNPLIDRTILGDYEFMDFDGSTEGVQIHYDDLGNAIRDTDSPKVMDDNLYGSNVNDLMISGFGNDIITAQDGNDHIQAGGDQDKVLGGDGNDLIEGGWDTDILSGGTGDDHIYANEKISIDEILDPDSQITENSRDWLSGGQGDDLLVGSHGQNALTGGDGSDLMYAGEGDDYIFGDGDALAQSFDWQATLVNYETKFEPVAGVLNPSQGDKDIIFAGGGNDSVWGQWGNDTLYGEDGEDTLTGGENDDVLQGGNDNDFLYGDRLSVAIENHGDDILNGGQGDDQLVGHAGNDILYGEEGDDALFGDGEVNPSDDGEDYLSGGLGHDYLVGSGGHDVLFGGDGNDYLLGDDDWSDELYHGDDYLDGGAGDDILLGHGGNDSLTGGDGFDVLSGDSGADTLIGGLGDDRLYGETSVVADEDHSNDFLSGGEGNDILAGGGADDRLSGGYGNDSLDGDANNINQSIHGDDHINGDAGIDTIWGSGGNDIIYGGDDDDTLMGDGNHIELQYQGNDRIYGNNGNDALFGYAGNDTLDGGAGDDYIEGNAGDDKLRGDSGNDILYADSGNDVLTGGQGNDFLDGGAGYDRYMFNLGDGIDYIRDSGNNSLRFGTNITFSMLSLSLGSLQINIDGSNDAIHIENFDPDNPYASVAIDRFEFSDGTVVDYKQLLSLGIVINGTSADETIIGTNSDDILRAYAGNDTIIAKDGDDILDGGSGSDMLYGNSGDDTYHVDSINDRVIELANEGYDTIESQISYTLGEHVEALTLQGTALTGQGNSNDNLLMGNALDNTLQGHDGDDEIYAYEGSDLLDGGSGNDVLDGGEGLDDLQGGEGNDSYYVDGTSETILVPGDDDDGDDDNNEEPVPNDHPSKSLANAGVGNGEDAPPPGQDQNWNDGAGTSPGNPGNKGGVNAGLHQNQSQSLDTLATDSASDTPVAVADQTTQTIEKIIYHTDTVTELAGGGYDTVYADISYTLTDHVEELHLTGSEAHSGTGNDLDNHIYGNQADNALEGDAGDDSFYYQSGDGLNTISDSAGQDRIVFGDTIQFEQLVVRNHTMEGVTTAQLRILDLSGQEQSDQGIDIILDAETQSSAIEYFVMADGSEYALNELTAAAPISESPAASQLTAPNLDGQAVDVNPSETYHNNLNAAIIAFEKNQIPQTDNVQQQWQETHAALDSLSAEPDEEALGGSLTRAGINAHVEPFAYQLHTNPERENHGAAEAVNTIRLL